MRLAAIIALLTAFLVDEATGRAVSVCNQITTLDDQIYGGEPRPGEDFRDCPNCPEMVALPSGSFVMGSPSTEIGRSEDEGPQRVVEISRSFAVGKYEVTRDEYNFCVSADACLAIDAEHQPDDGRRPVVYVSWDHATAYAAWLSQKTGSRYRLLSEAEWEYAARAGSASPYPTGDSARDSLGNCWEDYCRDGFKNSAPVGSFAPNAFGLHDMHGNVWEWVQDCYAYNYLAGQRTDGSAHSPANCTRRVVRGGSWSDAPLMIRSAERLRMYHTEENPLFGFRVAKTLSEDRDANEELSLDLSVDQDALYQRVSISGF